ncbi:MAG: PAS domain S-box protein, partial [Sphingomonadaceae bacterium]
MGGWTFEAQSVPGFGSSYCRMQPLTAISHVFLMSALVASIRRRTRPALFLLMPPCAVVATTMLQDASGIALGVDTFFFGEHVAHQSPDTPGRPSAMTAVTIALLVLATLISTRRGQRPSQAIVMLACVGFGIAAIAGTAAPLGLALADGAARHALLSIPTAASTAMLSIAFIAWRHGEGWPGLLSIGGMEGRTLRTIFALSVLAPIVFGTIRLWASRNTNITRELAELIQANAQIVVSVAILFWAWARIGRSNVIHLELT